MGMSEKGKLPCGFIGPSPEDGKPSTVESEVVKINIPAVGQAAQRYPWSTDPSSPVVIS